MSGRVLEWDLPRLLEYEWTQPGLEVSVVRYELQADPAGTILKLTHRRSVTRGAIGGRAGWHAYLDRLAAHLEGLPVPGWSERREQVQAAYGESPLARSKARRTNMNAETASVRYMIDEVPAAIAFYTQHLGFTLETDASPAFASVVRGPLRLLLSGPGSSGGWPMRDGSKPVPGGWTRIQVFVDDIESAVARLREAGVPIRNDIVKGVGGSQVLVDDPSGNPVELWQSA